MVEEGHSNVFTDLWKISEKAVADMTAIARGVGGMGVSFPSRLLKKSLA